MQTFEKDGKVMAKISDLRVWPKNPKFIKEENLEKLKKQITELGLYKPLVITPNKEILKNNQRFKALSQLKIEEVWISIVETWTDSERLKYCLSDNTNLGEYKREELYELVKPLTDQQSLFEDYNLELNEPQNLKQFVDDFVLGVDELKVKQLKKVL